MRRLAIAISLILLMFVFVACEKEPVFHTISFNSNGEMLENIIVQDGSPLPNIEEPVREGHDFTGWYYDEACTQKVDLKAPVKSDMTLYAGWEKIEIIYTISFNANGDNVENIPESIPVQEGEIPEEPKEPTRNGYIFLGWYTSDNNEFDFNTPITSDITLYAGWTEKEHTIDGVIKYEALYTESQEIYFEVSVQDKDSLTGVVKIESEIDGIPVTTIGNQAFKGCKELTSIEIPSSVTTIEDEAFYNCTGLTLIKIPEGVTTIGDEAFFGCRNLNSIEIPGSVTTIGDKAFSSCKITSVKITGNTELTDFDWIQNRAIIEFFDITNTDTIKYSNGILANTDSGSMWTFKKIVKGEAVIPKGVTTVGESAFYGCKELTSIVIPEGVTTIESWAFADCPGLTSINMPESVTTIGGWAFYDCTNLSKITLPKVTIIYNGAFFECSNLSTIYLPNVTDLGRNAAGAYRGVFEECRSLTTIEIPNSVTSIGKDTFSGCTNLQEIKLNFTQENCPFDDTDFANWDLKDSTKITYLDSES